MKKLLTLKKSKDKNSLFFQMMIQNKSSDFMKNLILKIVKKLRSFTKFENNLIKQRKIICIIV